MTSAFSFVPAGGTGQDRLIDPFTLDYIRTANGEWTETPDSRTIFLIALSVHLGESPFDPTHGSDIARRLRAGIGLTAEFLQAETLRVGAELAAQGVLSDLHVQVRDAEGNRFRDEAGRLAIKVEWRDLSSASSVNTFFTVR